MTTKTPYDVEIAHLEALPKGTRSDTVSRAFDRGLAMQAAYLRALADTQPRIDALVAALRDSAFAFDELAAYLRHRGDNPELAIARAAQARAALKLAGKEG